MSLAVAFRFALMKSDQRAFQPPGRSPRADPCTPFRCVDSVRADREAIDVDARLLEKATELLREDVMVHHPPGLEEFGRRGLSLSCRCLAGRPASCACLGLHDDSPRTHDHVANSC